MHAAFIDLLRWRGTVERQRFVLVGLVGVACKQVLDRWMASVAGLSWSPLSYWLVPIPRESLDNLTVVRVAPLVAMLAVSLPFAWIGVGLTIRRLRDAGLPTGLAALFFVPAVNLLFLALIAALPSRAPGSSLPGGGGGAPGLRRGPFSRWRVLALSVLATSALGVLLVVLCVHVFRGYGLSLFVALPFGLGLVAAVLQGRGRAHGLGSCLLAALLSVSVLGGLLLGLAFEGVICILMAAPIGVLLAVLGAMVGHATHQRVAWTGARNSLAVVVLALAGTPVAEHAGPREQQLFEVTTAVDVAAPPAVVWRHVVSFGELPPPTELLFRSGIAYPTRAEIDGDGAGAVRRCVFSTGEFVEPIETWDAPRVLRFRVASNPPPMREWSPFAHVDAPHLSGFLVSHEGEFRLVPLPGGRTRLLGTTWYEHGMQPAAYWRLFSDAIIHRIHRRVLEHVRWLSESEAQEMGAAGRDQPTAR